MPLLELENAFCVMKNVNPGGGLKCIKCGKGEFIDGSALISIKVSNKFSGYVFIELNEKNIKNLEKFISDEISPDIRRKIKIKKDDSNILLKEIYKHIPAHTGCLIFLDPEGPELYWETIKQLSFQNLTQRRY